MRKIFTRITASSAAAITIAASFTGVVGATTFNGRHYDPPSVPSSYWSKSFDSTLLKNKTHLTANVSTTQQATSGGVQVKANDDRADATAGSISTGSASNSNSSGVTMAVDNTGSNQAAFAAASSASSANRGFSPSGPSAPVISNTSSVSKTTAINVTDLTANNTTYQTATSGSVEVKANDDRADATAGNISTGSASNSNTSSVVLTVTN